MRANAQIDREVEAMRATADQAQRITFWQLLALIPVVVFLVTGFSILITRPIRQVDAAIRRLGAGQFRVPVSVSGPEDLEQLGERQAQRGWLCGRFRVQLLDVLAGKVMGTAPVLGEPGMEVAIDYREPGEPEAWADRVKALYDQGKLIKAIGLKID